MNILSQHFGDTVVTWQKTHGRHNLPWQKDRTPYAVWLSEIMLQQTQVATVCDYFTRFIQRFPTVADLAAAQLDEVLGLWSGLGYYSRARNLHRAAQDVVVLHGGVFPSTAQALQTLPGVGRSTAAAVASLCFGEPVAILDGNVKRVLTRYLGFKGDLASTRVEKELWTLAHALLPQHDVVHAMPTYTQGVMDLGATVCSSKQPRCGQCPLASSCVARAEGQPEAYPVKTRKLKRTAEQLWLLQAMTTQGDVWLMQRPHKGVWAGLYCLPVFDDFQGLLAALPPPLRTHVREAPAFKHVLTHKDLHLHPICLELPCAVPLDADLASGQWFDAQTWPALGLPAPVRKLLAPSKVHVPTSSSR